MLRNKGKKAEKDRQVVPLDRHYDSFGKVGDGIK